MMRRSSAQHGKLQKSWPLPWHQGISVAWVCMSNLTHVSKPFSCAAGLGAGGTDAIGLVLRGDHSLVHPDSHSLVHPLFPSLVRPWKSWSWSWGSSSSSPPSSSSPVFDHEREVPVSAGQQERWWGCGACVCRGTWALWSHPTPPHPTANNDESAVAFSRMRVCKWVTFCSLGAQVSERAQVSEISGAQVRVWP